MLIHNQHPSYRLCIRGAGCVSVSTPIEIKITRRSLLFVLCIPQIKIKFNRNNITKNLFKLNSNKVNTLGADFTDFRWNKVIFGGIRSFLVELGVFSLDFGWFYELFRVVLVKIWRGGVFSLSKKSIFRGGSF